MRRSRQNNGSRQRRRASAQKFDQRRSVENHSIRIPILNGFPIETSEANRRPASEQKEPFGYRDYLRLIDKR